MGHVYDDEKSEAEIIAWWDDEFDSTVLVGSDNSGARMEYIARSQEEIDESIAFLVGRHANS